MSRVPVVEDDPWIQWMVADDLANRDYDVKTTYDVGPSPNSRRFGPT